MSILRTIAMFIYLFGYMILHYGVLRRAERAAAAGDTATVEQIVNQHIPRWSRGILKVTGVSTATSSFLTSACPWTIPKRRNRLPLLPAKQNWSSAENHPSALNTTMAMRS